MIEMGIATQQEAHAAMCRVAQSGIDQAEARREKRRKRRPPEE